MLRRFRVKFIKGEQVKFLSHLDILRTFNRALRRSGVPVAYSQGFNPHPLMSFALPLSVGTTSCGELVDIDIEGDINLKDFINTINKGLPEYLKAVDVKEADLKSNIMALINAAKYRVEVYAQNTSEIEEKISELLSKDEILIEKESKKGSKEIDIRPGIRDIKINANNKNCLELLMTLDAGSKSNIKPEMVINALEKYYNINLDDMEVERIELFY